MNYLKANWHAPFNIQALTTTRLLGKSQAPFDANNLALHVEDNPDHVHHNRQELMTSLHLPHEPIWLNQTHSTRCVEVKDSHVLRDADAAVTRCRTLPLAIMTADCLPIVICDQQGQEVAAIHAGWRGLVGGIIENTLHTMQSPTKTCIAWIGPAICKDCYETGAEVFEQFKARFSDADKAFSHDPHTNRLHADLALMAELILLKSGIHRVYQSKVCTFESHDKYYSYRRSAKTGRIATLIWFQDAPQ